MKKLSFSIMLFVNLLMACQSPLLNHSTAQELSEAPADSHKDSAPASTSACPLSLPKHGLCAVLDWSQTPNDQDANTFTLRFWKLAEATLNGPYADPQDTVSVKLWMQAMGHGSAPVSLSPALDAQGLSLPGVFTGTNVYFVMPGVWTVKIQLKQGSIVTEEADLDVQI